MQQRNVQREMYFSLTVLVSQTPSCKDYTTTGYDARAYGHRLRSLSELRSGECFGFSDYANVLAVRDYVTPWIYRLRVRPVQDVSTTYEERSKE